MAKAWSMSSLNAAERSAPLRLDSHLHLWALADGQYSWVQPAHGILYNTFTPEMAQPVLVAQGVSQAFLVQADDTAADTEAMLAAAAAHDWIVGVVGWLPLEEPSTAEALVERWSENDKFCGVRTLIHTDPRPQVLELETVRASLALLAKAGIPFDVPDAFPRHLRQVADLAAALPELMIVVDHLGKPPRGGTAEQMQLWAKQLGDVAALPNTVAKVSGLHTDAAEFSAQALEQVWDVALEAFGPHRLMFGGDWPVSLLGGSYAQTLQLSASLIDSLSGAESQAIWAGTAQRVYKR